MQATNYYQASTENALPLIMHTKAAYLNALNSSLDAFERNCLEVQQFKGCLGDVGIISHATGKISKVYIGAGESTATEALAHAVNRLPEGVYAAQFSLTQSARVIWSTAQYRFDRYKAHKIAPRVLALTPDELSAVKVEATAIFLVRDLINTPANDLNPHELSKVVSNLATQYGAEFKQWVGDELLTDNFPAIHAVGRAAAVAPRLLSLTWGDVSHPRVTLVGKGVCFDSGGLDIKPSSGMRLMKKDMGGAAQVIGLAQWLMSKQVPIRLRVLIPAVENAISAQAFRPGDVLTMRNALTVEVDNTDAEGRLILADSLVKACEDKPELLINFATLTGAARVAVGTEIAAMFTNNDQLAQALSETAKETNDPVWRMPLFKGYANLLDSSIADLANSSASPYGGAIFAALFLQRFINDVPWVHFDIMAWNVGNKPGKPEGGEAMGMQTVGHYLLNRFGQLR